MLTEFPVVVSLYHIHPLLFYFNEMGGTELYLLKVMGYGDAESPGWLCNSVMLELVEDAICRKLGFQLTFWCQNYFFNFSTPVYKM